MLWLVGLGRRTRLEFKEDVLVETRTFDLNTGREDSRLDPLELPKAIRVLTPRSSQRPPMFPIEAPSESDFDSSRDEPAPLSAAPSIDEGEKPSEEDDSLFSFSQTAEDSNASSQSADGAKGANASGFGAYGAGQAKSAEGSDEAFVGEAVNATDLFGEDLDGLLPASREKPSGLNIHGYVETLLMFGENGPSPHVFDTGLNGRRGLEAKEGVFHLDAALGNDVHFFGQIRAVRFNSFDMRIAMLQLGDPSGSHWTIGRQISPFGTFPVRNLSDENPLYGYPVSYFYRSSVRPDQVHQNTAGLLAARGTGGGGRGMALAGPGLYQTYALYNANLGKTGKFTFGLENGAQSRNENRTTNDRFGVVGRASFAPTPSFQFGFSGSVATYMDDTATGLAPGEDANDFQQELYGVDFDLAKGKFRLIGEAMWSQFDVTRSLNNGQLGSFGWYLESKYDMAPKVFLAGRYSAMDFEEVDDGAGGRTSWDYDVDRLEVGIGYRPTVNVLAKLSGQHNKTDDIKDPDDDIAVLQLIGSF